MCSCDARKVGVDVIAGRAVADATLEPPCSEMSVSATKCAKVGSDLLEEIGQGIAPKFASASEAFFTD
jgi:hypothetical protein